MLHTEVTYSSINAFTKGRDELHLLLQHSTNKTIVHADIMQNLILVKTEYNFLLLLQHPTLL